MKQIQIIFLQQKSCKTHKFFSKSFSLAHLTLDDPRVSDPQRFFLQCRGLVSKGLISRANYHGRVYRRGRRSSREPVLQVFRVQVAIDPLFPGSGPTIDPILDIPRDNEGFIRGTLLSFTLFLLSIDHTQIYYFLLSSSLDSQIS